MAREFSVVVGINASRAIAGGRQFKAGADQVNRSNRGMQRSTAATTRRMTAMITTMGRIRGVASVMFSGFLGVGGLTAVTRTITQFTSALSKVEALLGDRAIGGAMTALEQKARALGATTVFTATQAAEGMQFLTLAGFDALEVYQAIGPALELAQAGALGLGQAADIVSNIMAGFSIEAEHTGQVVDALAFVASRTNTNIQQLGEAMKFVAPVAGAVGISVEETAAALGILGNAGLQASLAGTSLRRVFSGLLNPSKEATSVLGGMGLKAQELVDKIGKPGGLNEVVHILAERGLGAAEAFTLFGQRGAPGILSLINQREKLGKLNITMQDITGTAKDMATVMTDNLGGDARLAISALQEGILQLGDAGLTQWLRDTTQGFGGFIRGLTDVKVNMFEATDAMKSGIAAGQNFKKNIDTVQKALFIFITYLSRNAIRAIAAFIVQLGLATAATAGFGSSIIRLGVSANTTRVALARMKAVLVSTGVGALVVGFGLLLQKMYEMWQTSKDIVDVNAEAEKAFMDLSDEVNIAAHNFDQLTAAERRQAAGKLETVIAGQITALQGLGEAADNARVSQMLLPPALERQEAALQSLNEVYGEGFDLQTIYAAAGSENAAKLTEYREAVADVTSITEQFGEAVLDEVLPSLERMERNLAINQERQRVWNLMIQDSNLSLREATDIIQGNVNAKEAYIAALKEETGLNEDQFTILQALIKKYGQVKADTKDLAANYQLVAGALARLVANGEGASATAEQLRVVLKNLGIEMGKDAAKAAEKLADAFQKIEDRLNPLPALTRKFEEEALILAQVIGTDTPEAVARLRAELLKLRGEYDENIDKLTEVCDKNKKVRECTEDSVKRMEEVWKQGMRNIQDSFAEAFKNMLDGSGDFFDGILDAFKDMIANMLAAWAISGISNLFSGASFGANGNGIGQILSSGLGQLTGGGGGGGGLLGGAGGAGSGGTGPLSGISAGVQKAFDGFISGVGTFFAGAANFFQTHGTINGLALVQGGTGLGGVGTGSAAITAEAGGLAGAGAVAAGAGVGALSGAVADAILGGRGDPTRNAIFSVIGGAIGSIWGPIGSVIGGAIGSFVDNLFGGAKKLESAVLELSVAGDNIFAVQEEIVSKQKSFFRGKKYTTTRTNISNQFNTIEEEFAAFVATLSSVTEEVGGFTDFIDTFEFSRDINLKAANAQDLIKRAVADLFQAATDAFLRDVEGLPERMELTLRSFSDNLEDFIKALELTLAVENLFDIDLVAAASDQIAASQVGIVESYQQSLAAYRGVIAEYDGSIESLEALATATAVITQMQLDLITIYEVLGREVSAMFEGSAQTIREALMSEEELYQTRRDQIDALVEQASQTTDPEELGRLAEEINRLGLDAFNMLDEDQRAILGPEFIEFFEGLDSLFGDQIAEGIGGVVQDQADLDLEVATRMEEAAQAIIDAARALENEARRREDERELRREIHR